jgi:hypothetical protein
MANNQKKLKAFVRYDGSGRVVASSLILRKNKPRVGRWYEIPEYLCCNGTTNTTTTQGGGGNTPTAWIVSKYVSENNACLDAPIGTAIVYTESNIISIGTTLWANAALTIPFNEFNTYYLKFSNNSNIYSIAIMQTTFISGVISCTTTTTTTTQASISVGTTSESCGTPNTFVAVSFVVGSNICDTSVQLQGSFSMFPSEFYVIYGGFSRLVIKISDSIIQGVGGAPGECVSCG